jgi:hypothetical protein
MRARARAGAAAERGGGAWREMRARLSRWRGARPVAAWAHSAPRCRRCARARCRTHISANLTVVSVMEMAVMTARKPTHDVRCAAEPLSTT